MSLSSFFSRVLLLEGTFMAFIITCKKYNYEITRVTIIKDNASNKSFMEINNMRRKRKNTNNKKSRTNTSKSRQKICLLKKVFAAQNATKIKPKSRKLVQLLEL